MEKVDFTVESMKSALLAVESKMTERQREMLIAHYQHRTLSTGRIAEIVGYNSYRIANMQYGTLCGRIASALGYVPSYDKIGTIASISPKRDKLGHSQWHLDRNVVEALEELGWVDKKIKHSLSG